MWRGIGLKAQLLVRWIRLKRGFIRLLETIFAIPHKEHHIAFYSGTDQSELRKWLIRAQVLNTRAQRRRCRAIIARLEMLAYILTCALFIIALYYIKEFLI